MYVIIDFFLNKVRIMNKSVIIKLQFALSSFLVLVATIILPLIIWKLRLPIIESTYDGSAPNTIDSQPFEIFGFFTTIILVLIAWLQIKQQKNKSISTIVPIVLPVLVLLNNLFILVETVHVKSSDFMCYENAARAIINAANPYTGTPPCYLYPPLSAQILSYLYQFLVYNPIFAFADDIRAWTAVSYIYQCAQFLQIALAYYLTFLFVQDLKIKKLKASFLISGIFLFNYPLVRTITFDQINLWILNSFLLGILLLRRYPFLSGLAIALGTHIKLYNLVLLLPWIATKRWKAIIGTFVGVIAIVSVQTNWFNDWSLWSQFFSYLSNPEKPTNYRNNSIWSLVFNLVKIPNKVLHLDILFKLVPIIVTILTFLVSIYFIIRFIQRKQIYDKILKNDISEIFYLYGNSIDAIAFSLLNYFILKSNP